VLSEASAAKTPGDSISPLPASRPKSGTNQKSGPRLHNGSLFPGPVRRSRSREDFLDLCLVGGKVSRLIVAPWLLGFEESNAVMVDVIIGIVVAVLATFEIWLALDRRGPTGGGMAAQG
jgi:SPW repeat